MNNIDKKYGVPIENISCPGCGKKYGYYNRKVDINSEECSKCAYDFKRKNIKLVEAEYFIEKILEYKPYTHY